MNTRKSLFRGVIFGYNFSWEGGDIPSQTLTLPIRSFTVQENHIRSAVREIFRYTHTDRKTSCYFYISIIHWIFYYFRLFSDNYNIVFLLFIINLFRAYNRLVSDFGEEPRLPGLPYTNRQLFWLSGASIWCNAIRPASLKNRVLTDPHSPGRFRVNGSYRNSKEFAQDWNCPVGSNMNPAKKCSVW